MTAIPRTVALAALAELGAGALAALAVILRGGEFDAMLLALFSLSVIGYLATPLLARLLPPEAVGSPR